MKIISLILVCSLLSSCGWNDFRRKLGAGNEAPDEFMVEEKKDLTIPKELTLPKPGSGKTKAESKRTQAEQLIYGGVDKGSTSDIDRSFEKQANLDETNSNIRNVIEDEYENETSIFGTSKGSTLESIVDPFGYNRAKPKLVDGMKENARIRKSLSSGEKIDTDEVIVIEDW